MLAAPHLEASAALEVVAVKLGKAGGRLDDSLLRLCFFFVSSWDRFGPWSAWRNLDTTHAAILMFIPDIQLHKIYCNIDIPFTLD